MSTDCCNITHHDHNHDHSKRDIIFNGSLVTIIGILFGYILFPQNEYLHTFAYTIIELFHTVWWGVLLGILFLGLMTKTPKEYFSVVLGQKDNLGGIVRATIAGLFLDLCNHGIILVAAKLYERGVSLAKVMAFMIASPWNSFSLTIILIALIGIKWTLIYTAGSIAIALTTGLIYGLLTKAKQLPENPNKTDIPKGFSLREDAKKRLKSFKLDKQFIKDVTLGSLTESKTLLRWLLLSVVITAAIRTFVPTEMFGEFFGPTFMGLLATLAVTTILEVCSEGSAPIASEILHRAKAPGNGFAFLMAGVSTDYTEIMIIREFSKSWWIAFSLPLITVPQILLLGWVMNMAS